ncbi:basic amino acid/polyamine antiporter [Kingella negevensis]|uniref:Putative arginine/ornithine antiporter n=1 Tax=Kingella negevensis TaxID=1522312 RepID=A0A238TBP3_9NEIS|nr:basic amino acid/polyamine antiporter [Kingella negevensis]MDK4680810.1 basic amino acid/polyamine antiporter [Kingella negevensis]MDK4681467.1 basic amino acid/polyamine antiporter [Kingella negevensis]MDK4684249.1 basic amino acid/polyamine antiporter [Kingella negevensis]MDK4691854.1 basic amino acid/polyamine antiporter [Kingella negevensis]MDK4692993.1 basic amino acid/polyamine antiporter [Kingella negevensis]
MSSQSQIGLTALTALVISSMVGSGIFSLPQNMTAVAGSQALLIGWLITGAGIIFLGLAFGCLSKLKPELDGGIYTYARDGFGDLMGFFSAWGYWLCTTIGIVGYLVVAFEAVGGFVDSPDSVILGQGNTFWAFVGESAIAWLIYWLVARGIKEAAGVNLIATAVKVFPLIVFIGLAAYFFKSDVFMGDWSGASIAADTSVMSQVKDTMLITLWVFTGIEGAVVLSKHAKSRADIGKATVGGVAITLAMYVAITLLAQGILPRAEIAAMANPSMAGVLSHMVGDWGKVLISFCLIVSVLSSYLSWTLYATEIPHLGAKNAAFPKQFLALNGNEVPHHSLLFTTLTVQLCLFLVWQTGNSYSALLMISTSMILVPYLLIGLYLVKLAYTQKLSAKYWVIGVISSVYAFWIVYAAGVNYLLLSVLLYLVGTVLFLFSQWQQRGKWQFTLPEKIVLAILAVLAVPAIQQFVASLNG